MLLRTSVLLQLVGALITTQVCHAMPQPTHVLNRRDEPNPPPTESYPIPWSLGTFGKDHQPNIRHLEQASKQVATGGDVGGLSKYLVTLLGFTKCNPQWVESWFPNHTEVSTAPSLQPGQAYVLPFMPVDGKRRATAVQREYLDTLPIGGKMFEPALVEGTAWWHWALLKGISGSVGTSWTGRTTDEDPRYNHDEITLALSSFKVVEETDLDKEKLWEGAFKSSASSPVWMETKNDGFVLVMSTSGEGDDRMVRYTRFEDDKAKDGAIKHFDVPFGETVDGITRLTHLEGYPAFVEGTRQGVWPPEKLETIEASVEPAPKPSPTNAPARRDETKAPQVTETGKNPIGYGTFGKDDEPKISHLEEASKLVADSGDPAGISRYLVTLLAFTKCNPQWIESWYPNASDTGEKSVLRPYEAWVLPFSAIDDKRIEKGVKWKSMIEMVPLSQMFANAGPPPADGVWWPWALLQGVTERSGLLPYGEGFDFDALTLGLSSFKVVEETDHDKEKLWEGAFKSSDWSPVWIDTKDDGYVVVMSTSGEGDDRWVRYTRFEDGAIKHFDKSLDETVASIKQVSHLENYPRFVPGVRQGVWSGGALSTLALSAEKPEPPQSTVSNL